MKIAFYILFILTALSQLYFCVPPQKHLLRRYTKPLLMPFLIGCYAFSVAEPSLFTVLFLALCCVGDSLLLLPDKSALVRAGLTAFAGASLCNAIALLQQLGSRPSLLFIGIAIGVYVILLCWYLFRVSVYPSPAIAPFLCAAATAAAFSSLAALLYAFTNTGVPSKFVFAGSLFFLLSGVMLSLHLFRKRIRLGNLCVMLFYILAQALMIFGRIGATGA